MFYLESIKTRSNKAEINFVSDHSGEYSGFKLQWKAYKKEISNALPVVQKNQERGWCLVLYFLGILGDLGTNRLFHKLRHEQHLPRFETIA